MKVSLVIGATAAVLLACGSAVAQVQLDEQGLPALDATPTTPESGGSPGTSTSTGTSGTGTPVGIPLGAMELATPGISPPPTSANGCTITATPGAPSSTGVFDGGGMAGMGSTACAAGSSPAAGTTTTGVATTSTPPALSTGRAGIPEASTEIVSPGLSPLPPVTTLPLPTLSAPLAAAPPAPATVLSPPSLPQGGCPPTPAIGFSSTLRTARGTTGAAVSGC
jgi:hypothetical protein